jgi:NifU-like protein involved in Fe-S cluster formation
MSALYSRAILRLAVASANWPLREDGAARIERRAPLCGSRIILQVTTDAEEQVTSIGFTVHACAVGQAAATLLARGIAGQQLGDVEAAARQLAAWLDDADAALPDWPDITELDGVRAYPARHGAALLPFLAAIDALCGPASEIAA